MTEEQGPRHTNCHNIAESRPFLFCQDHQQAYQKAEKCEP